MPARATGTGSGAETLRRLLLGAVTMLVVARPLVLGEDPGLLLRPFSDAGGLVLTLLWFLTGAGWAVWRVWSGERTWLVSPVEAGLLGVVAMAFVSAAAAAYPHPAWLIAWEWLALLVGFLLVRDLVRSPAENQRLLAALVAGGVSLSAYAIYQYTVEFPQQREQFGSPEAIRAELQRQNIPLTDDRTLEVYQKRAAFDHVFATFAHPNSFAGYLALLLPAGVGWAAVSWRRQRRSWRTPAAVAGALLLAVALWLTHSRGAILGVFLAAAIVGVIHLRQRLGARANWVIGAAVVLLAVGALLLTTRGGGGEGVDKSRRSLGLRVDYWASTWDLIRSRPRFVLLGVGPGNFGDYYPRFMRPAATEEVKDPHNFALEVWATCGVFALAALLVALVAFFRHIWPVIRGPVPESEPPALAERPRRATEFYLGGMAGLVLGFLLWASGQTGEGAADVILIGGLVAGVRSLLWFAAFALYEGIAWTGPSRVLALIVGVAALLINLCVSGGISFPAVALPLWVVMALALNGLPAPVGRSLPQWAGYLPVPLLATAGLVYFAFFYAPVTEADSAVRSAQLEQAELRHILEAAAQEKMPEAQQRVYANAARYAERAIVPSLEAAIRADPGDAYPPLELGHVYGQLWTLSPQPEFAKQAAVEANRAIELDPEGTDGYLLRYQVNMLFARRAGTRGAGFYGTAVKTMRQVVQRRPTSALMRYQLAEALMLAGQPVEAREEAREALRLDDLCTEPLRKLTDDQRKQIRQWLERPA